MISIFRKDLYEKIWSKGITKTAKELDVPYIKLKKASVDNDIPLPTQSYWSKLYMGNEKPTQPELPNTEDNSSTSTKKKEEKSYFAYLKDDEKKLMEIYNSLKINKTLSTKPHKEIVKYRKKTQSYREDKLRIKSALGEIIPEVLPFIDSLFKTLEKAGAKIMCEFDEIEVLYNDKYTFTLNFKLPCKRITLSPGDEKYSEYHTFEYKTKGKINVEVGYKAYWYRWGRNEKSINQTKKMTTGDLLRKVFIYMSSLPEIIDEEEKAYIIREEQRLKEEEERLLLQAKRDNEYEKTQKLINNSFNYFHSKIIKEYVTAEFDDETAEYIWAMEKADWIRDSEKFPDEFLTENEKEKLLNKKTSRTNFW